MKVKDCMTADAVSASAEESAAMAARLMARHNIGSLPVQSRSGRLVGIITDRDLVLRCMALGENPSAVPLENIMTTKVVTAAPDEPLSVAAERMSREQIRRLPVVQDGRLVGILALADVSRRQDYSMEAGQCLSEISKNVKKR